MWLGDTSYGLTCGPTAARMAGRGLALPGSAAVGSQFGPEISLAALTFEPRELLAPPLSASGGSRTARLSSVRTGRSACYHC